MLATNTDGSSAQLTGSVGEHIETTVENGVIGARLLSGVIETVSQMWEEIETLKQNVGQGSAIVGRLGDLAQGEMVTIFMNGQFRPWRVLFLGTNFEPRQNIIPPTIVQSNSGYMFSAQSPVDLSDVVMLIQNTTYESWRIGLAGTAEYVDSEIHNRLNTEYITYFQDWLRDKLLTCRAPAQNVLNGLHTTIGFQPVGRVFLPSITELSLAGTAIQAPNPFLETDNWGFADNASRIYRNAIGTAVIYGTRTQRADLANNWFHVAATGALGINTTSQTAREIRPIIALPKTVGYDMNRVLVDDVSTQIASNYQLENMFKATFEAMEAPQQEKIKSVLAGMELSVNDLGYK